MLDKLALAYKNAAIEHEAAVAEEARVCAELGPDDPDAWPTPQSLARYRLETAAHRTPPPHTATATATATARKSSIIIARDLLVTLANRTGGYPGIDGEIAALNRQIARN